VNGVLRRAKHVCRVLENVATLFRNGQGGPQDAAELGRLVRRYQNDAYNLRTSLIESGYTTQVDKISAICKQYDEIAAAADRFA